MTARALIAEMARAAAASGVSYRAAVAIFEAQHLAACMVATGGNMTRAARIAGFANHASMRRAMRARGVFPWRGADDREGCDA